MCFFLNLFAPWQETFADAGDGDGGDLFFIQYQNSNFDRGSGRIFWILNFAEYQYLFNTKIQNSTATAVDFWILLATNIYLIPKFKIRPRQRPKFEFWIFAKYHFLYLYSIFFCYTYIY